MRIIHITAIRNLNPGQRKQIESEVAAAKCIDGAQWKSIAIHDSLPKNPWERQVPYPFRRIFLRYLYAWYVIAKYARQNDYVLVRHMPFDIFGMLLAPFVRNRVTIHHACEPAELRIVRQNWKGRVAALVETITGFSVISSAIAVAGVTSEISVYEANRCFRTKPYFDFPNGIAVDNFDPLSDNRSDNTVEAAFICGEFTDWHGLDLFFDAVENSDGTVLRIHLIGKLLPKQKERLMASEKLQKAFLTYGVLGTQEYIPILEKCDFGIGSFALFRKGLEEASTLKVREYLAMGLPVYSGHKDTAFPKEFPYYVYTEELNLQSMLDFGFSQKINSRADVHHASTQFISKKAIIFKTIQTLLHLGDR